MASENDWVFDLDTTIFSIVKTKVTKKLTEKFPNIYFTSTGKTKNPPQFPTVYIHSLQGVEKGQDLERTKINAIQHTVQIDITTNTNQNDAKYVMKCITDIFKQMMFYVVAMPEMTSGNETYKSTARFRRVISANDTIL